MLPDPNTPKSESLPVASGNGETGVNDEVKLQRGCDKKVSINTHLNKYKSVFFMDKELITFLKKNRAYSKFMRNLTYKTIQDLNDAVVLAEEKGQYGNPIVAAFVWEDTPEGWEYWNDIEAKWNELH